MNHEIEAHFAQYCYLLKSEDDAPGWSFAAEHADKGDYYLICHRNM